MAESVLERSSVWAIQRRTMIVLMIAQIIGTVGVGVAPSIGVLLASEVTNNEAFAGLARTTSTIGAATFGLWLGGMAAQRGRRVALSGGWLLAGTGAALLVFAAHYSLIIPLFVGLFLLGAGSAVSLQSRFTATDLAEPRQRARSLALVVWVGTLGSVLGPNMGAPGRYVSSATGLTVYASSFMLASVFLFLAGIVIFFWLRPDPLLTLQKLEPAAAAGAVKGKQPGKFLQIFEEMRLNSMAKLAVIAIISAQAVMAAVMTMTPVHIHHEGHSINMVGITISLHVAGMFALAPLVGQVVDRFGHRASMAIGIVIFFMSFILGVIWPHSMTWIMVSLTLLGVGWSFVNIAGSALFSVVVTPERRATAQGGLDAMSNLGGATAAFAAGPVLVVVGFAALNIISMIVLIPLIFLVATMPVVLRLEHDRKPAPGD